MSEFKISKRYASAFLELGREKKLLQVFESDMKSVLSALNSNADLTDFLSNPVYPESLKIESIKKIFSKSDAFTLNFLQLVIEKKRENYLKDIITLFLSMVDEENGLVRAHVKSSVELSADLKAKLESGLKSKTGKTVILSSSIDSSIKGGVIVQVNDTVYDASVKHQLELLKAKFLLPS